MERRSGHGIVALDTLNFRKAVLVGLAIYR